jgi:hypothetical protein
MKQYYKFLTFSLASQARILKLEAEHDAMAAERDTMAAECKAIRKVTKILREVKRRKENV